MQDSSYTVIEVYALKRGFIGNLAFLFYYSLKFNTILLTDFRLTITRVYKNCDSVHTTAHHVMT